MIDQALALLLLINAAWVTYGSYRRYPMWKWIVVYWAILTVKNLVGLLVNMS